MGDSKIEEVYPLTGNDVELKRLNLQHRLLLTYCDHNLIHPSVIKENIENIADVATGTGVWLDDVAKTLECTPTRSGNERSYDGFDISSDMFPAVPKNAMSFHVQNMFEEFPKEFHGKYDFVHIRFVIGATKEDTYRVITQNLIPLLKPGGFIQWDDLRWPCDFFKINPRANQNNTDQAIIDLKSTDDIILAFLKGNNISCNLPDLVEDYLEGVGLRIITKHDYTLPDTEARIEAARGYRLQLLEAMQPILIRTGLAKTEEEAKTIVKKDREIFEKYFADGWYSTLPVVTVVAQKAYK